MNVVMVPSASGGIGHISRTATLARALRRLDPTVHIEYVLDAERLRPFNIDATMRMGYRPRLLPTRNPEGTVNLSAEDRKGWDAAGATRQLRHR